MYHLEVTFYSEDVSNMFLQNFSVHLLPYMTSYARRPLRVCSRPWKPENDVYTYYSHRDLSFFEQNKVQQGRKVKNPATLSENIGFKSRH